MKNNNLKLYSKEEYFTKDSIDNLSKIWLKKFKNLKKRSLFEFKPEKSALLILDMQRYFLDKNSHAHIPSALAIVDKIKKIKNFYLKGNYPIYATRHIDKEKQKKSMMLKWWRNSIKKDDKMSEIIEEFGASQINKIEKSQYDAFYKTNLEESLKNKGVTQLIITGVMTHLCCETTARSAFVRGFEVFFPIDATTTYNKEFHLSSILNLSHGFAIPVLINELIGKENEGI